MKDLINYERAAKVIGLSAPRMRALVARKEIPHYRIGPRTVRFDPVDLMAWVESRRVPVKGPVR